FRIAAHLVSDEDWTLKAHCSDCDSDDPTVGASDGDGAASKIHLRQEPAAKNISMRIGKHGHSNRPQRQLRFRRRLRRVSDAHLKFIPMRKLLSSSRVHVILYRNALCAPA